MADYTTHQNSSGRWLIIAGIAFVGIVLLVIATGGPERADPTAVPPETAPAANSAPVVVD